MKKKNQEATNNEKPQTPAAPKPTNRDIFVFGRLENEVALPVIRRILKLNQTDPTKPINMYINSSGGNGYNADAIIAIMSQVEAKVNTICLGHALSGACEILAAGTGERSAYEFATLMFHQTLWEADGDITNLEIQAAQGQRFRNAQIEVLHRCTGQSRERLRKDIERDHYMTAQEALEYGMIDRICAHKKKGKSDKSSSNHKNHEHKGLDLIADSTVKGVKQQKVASALAVKKKAARAKKGK
ncbi:MAG: ATP-dependent Clp protease proteolytic subunit [Candidatus Melainabacteria bacterium]|nr:MAG: ATP-dependent Clp protease proteolytic subunit [Candidatus Melainabacteria bacterium]